MAIVRIPTPLRRLTKEQDEVNSGASNVNELIQDLEDLSWN